MKFTLSSRLLVVLSFLLAGCSNQFIKFHTAQSFASTEMTQKIDSAPVIRYYGTSTFLIEYKGTRIMTDGYFSRKPHFLLAPIAPDVKQISDTLTASNIPLITKGVAAPSKSNLDAVIVMHGHYDHAMDAGLVAALTGATLIADDVTIRTAHKSLYPAHADMKLDTISLTTQHAFSIGDIDLRLIDVPHSDNPVSHAIDRIPEQENWSFPTHIWNMKLGKSVALHITMGPYRLLIVPTAGPITTEFYSKNIKADVVFLGIGGLGWQNPQEVSAYLHNSLRVTGAKRAVPIHWDNHQKQIDLNTPELFPPFYECLNCALNTLKAHKEQHYELWSAPALHPFNPFQDMPSQN